MPEPAPPSSAPSPLPERPDVQTGPPLSKWAPTIPPRENADVALSWLPNQDRLGLTSEGLKVPRLRCRQLAALLPAGDPVEALPGLRGVAKPLVVPGCSPS
jgi:hypothetical protein